MPKEENTPNNPLRNPYFVEQSGHYDLGRPPYIEEQVKWALDELGVTQESKMLEVAVGTGLLTRAILNQEHCPGEIVCIDIGPDMVELAKENLASYGNRVTVKEGNAEDIDLPDHSIDVIVMGDAGHWLNGPRTTNEFSRVLKPSGKIAVFARDPDQNSKVVMDLHDLLFKHCPGYDDPKASTYKRSEDLQNRIKGKHLISDPEEGTILPIHQKVDKNGLLEIISSNSAAGKWAQDHRAEAIDKVINPLFKEHADQDGTVIFTRISHVAIGSVKVYAVNMALPCDSGNNLKGRS